MSRPVLLRRRGLGLLALVLLWPPASALRAVRWTPPAPRDPGDGLHVVRLGMHVHSSLAGGRGAPEAIHAAARQAGLDALWLSEHDAFPAPGGPAPPGGLLVLQGSEESTDGGHLVALLDGRPAYPPGRAAAGAVDDIQQAGGKALAAHPLRPGSERLRWSGPLEPLDGIEVVNLDAAVRERWWRLPAALLATPFAPARALALAAGPERGARELWDSLLERRLVIATGGVDAHGGIPSYRAALGALANLVLLEEPASAEGLRRAVAGGQLLIAWTALADPRAARFTARAGGRRYLPGSLVPAGESVELILSSGLAVEARLRILHRGVVVAAADGREIRHRSDQPGAYRGEIDLPGAPHSPWLLTNPIGLAGAGWPRPASARPPGPGPLPPLASLLDLLAIEKDPASRGALERDERGATFDFALAASAPGGGELWVAVVARRFPALAGRRALWLEAEASAPLRVDFGVLLRGERRRAASPRLEARPGRHRLELVAGEAVEGIFLSLDRGNAWPGSRGRIRIHAFGLE